MITSFSLIIDNCFSMNNACVIGPICFLKDGECFLGSKIGGAEQPPTVAPQTVAPQTVAPPQTLAPQTVAPQTVAHQTVAPQLAYCSPPRC